MVLEVGILRIDEIDRVCQIRVFAQARPLDILIEAAVVFGINPLEIGKNSKSPAALSHEDHLVL